MEIKNSEWTEFAKFIANYSTYVVHKYEESEIHTCCPFSTFERAYAAFSVWRSTHSDSEVRKCMDVDCVVSRM